MNPLILSRLLSSLPDALEVNPEDAKAIKRIGASLELDLLHELSLTWQSMLAAKSWEEFVELRGVYKGLEMLLEMPGKISVLRAHDPLKNEDFEKVEEQLKGLRNAT